MRIRENLKNCLTCESPLGVVLFSKGVHVLCAYRLSRFLAKLQK